MSQSFVCDLTNVALIAITGEQAASFLQGQVTCDVREINTRQTRLGAHCNPKGRVLSSFRLLQLQGQFYLLTPRSMSTLIMQQLKKYAIFSKVVLQLADSLHLIGCVGTALAEQLTALVGPLPQQPDQCSSYPITAAETVLIIRVPGTVPRFEIVGTQPAITWLKQHLSATAIGHSALWQMLDIDAGIGTIHPQTSDLFTPQMLNYPALNAVSFKKGCYTGQEIIARTHYLGKAKRNLQKLSLASAALPILGDELYNSNQQVVGIIVAAALAETGKCVILAVVQDEAMAEELHWQQGATSVMVETTPV